MLTKDFKEFAELLNSNAVEYLIVGGYALAAHGCPRYTGDLDFWVGADLANAQKIVNALAQFGFGALKVTEQDLTRENNVIQLGYPPQRIDILTGIDGVNFAPCYARRWSLVVQGLPLNFISRADFVANKAASGRPKDLLDLELLNESGSSQKPA
jgi:hypothetical protein